MNIIYLLLLLILLGSSLVFYSISPYYATLGLVIVALLGCMILSIIGLNFLAMLLLLMYLGGMLVVFVFSCALSADRFPLVSNIVEMIVVFIMVSIWILMLFVDFLDQEFKDLVMMLLPDLVAISMLYSVGWGLLMITGWALLVVLIVVLIISFGLYYWNLRKLLLIMMKMLKFIIL